ncbi:MAG: fumarylacetoacetate hydrolase family protein [Actinomycetota bacterium]
MRLVTFAPPGGTPGVGVLHGDLVSVQEAPTMVAWLAGDGRRPTGATHPLADVTLLAPVPDPPAVRDFYAFEGHVAAGWRRRGHPVPDAWYRAPAFYFSNPAATRGPGEPVTRPAATRMLDFELEIAAVIGVDGDIAGFTLMNDWSARDVQREEMTVLLGPAKGKDFATSLGPWIATPDELPYRDGRLHMEAWVTVNGREVGRGDCARQHFTWPQIVAHAARDTILRPGDVLGSGTLDRGCLLELGPLDGERWIEPGDVVALHAPGLGTLETPVS